MSGAFPKGRWLDLKFVERVDSGVSLDGKAGRIGVLMAKILKQGHCEAKSRENSLSPSSCPNWEEHLSFTEIRSLCQSSLKWGPVVCLKSEGKDCLYGILVT